ncbi:MAG: hypothetical protein QM740_17800 [Acidovorax sp.]
MSAKTGRFLLTPRSGDVVAAGKWGTFSGAIEAGSNARRTATDKLFKITGYEDQLRLEELCHLRTPGAIIPHQTFLAIVEDEFKPWQSHEVKGAQWFNFGEWPEPLDLGLQYILSDEESLETIMATMMAVEQRRDLFSGHPPEERTLYHCLYKLPEGDALRASCLRSENGREDRFLYATPYLSKALAFAFSYHNNSDICCNGPIYGTPGEFAIICNREKTMAAPRPAKIYGFSSHGFESLQAGARQYVSTADVPFNKTKVVFETDNVQEIMRNGLQIFSVACTPEEFYAPGGLDEQYASSRSNIEMLHALLQSKEAIWENKEQNIGVSDTLVNRFKMLAMAQVSTVSKLSLDL